MAKVEQARKACDIEIVGFLWHQGGGDMKKVDVAKEYLDNLKSLVAEASIQPSDLIGGFWVFLYGLMVYLPASTVPEDRPAKPPRWWCYPLAVFLPFPCVVLAAPVVLLREWLEIRACRASEKRIAGRRPNSSFSDFGVSP